MYVLKSAPLNLREGLSMDLQGGRMFLLTLPVPPAPSFWYSIRILTVWTPFIPPSAPTQELGWVHLCCSFLYCNLEISNLQPPNAEVLGLSVCGASRVSRPARHLSKCRVSLKQCQTSRDSNFLPAFLTGEADSLYIPIVLRLFSPP